MIKAIICIIMGIILTIMSSMVYVEKGDSLLTNFSTDLGVCMFILGLVSIYIISNEDFEFISVKQQNSLEDTTEKTNKTPIINKIKVEVERFVFNLDFENTKLNLKLNNIENIINSIISLPVLENDSENKNLISSTQEKYIKQIHIAYNVIPKELREIKLKGFTGTDIALEQLSLVENGLLEVRNELLSQQMNDLKIMNRFIKEKFKEKNSYLKMKA